jgi:hypothetical protein
MRLVRDEKRRKAGALDGIDLPQVWLGRIAVELDYRPQVGAIG